MCACPRTGDIAEVLERLSLVDCDPRGLVLDIRALQADWNDLLDRLVMLVNGFEQIGVGAEVVRCEEGVIEMISSSASVSTATSALCSLPLTLNTQ